MSPRSPSRPQSAAGSLTGLCRIAGRRRIARLAADRQRRHDQGNRQGRRRLLREREEMRARLQVLGDGKVDRVRRVGARAVQLESARSCPGLTARGNDRGRDRAADAVKSVSPGRVARVGRVADLKVIGAGRGCLER